MSRSLVAMLAVLAPSLAYAEVPQVVADIPPVHGLVARVMDGVGEPTLLVRPGASPHGYALKPSEAGALEKAQAVFFVGEELTSWLMRPIETLSPNSVHVKLLAAPGTVSLDSRNEVLFSAIESEDTHEGHDHGHDDDHGHDQDHGDHDHEHSHDDHAGHHHEEHAHDVHAGHDHSDPNHTHEGTDPHAWLDPENGRAWTRAIAAELSKLDPDNTAAYEANAQAAIAEIDAAEADTRKAIEPLAGLRFVGFHDAYQYFENRFGVHAAGSIALSDAAPPGPARITQLRDAVAQAGIDCALAEPQFDPDLLKTVFDGTEVKTAVIDPIGADIPTGATFYPQLINSIGAALQACR